LIERPGLINSDTNHMVHPHWDDSTISFHENRMEGHTHTQIHTHAYTHTPQYTLTHTGDFDTCEEKGSALWMCLSNKVKKDPAIQEASCHVLSCVCVCVCVCVARNLWCVIIR
jgi:hypothetical protein